MYISMHDKEGENGNNILPLFFQFLHLLITVVSQLPVLGGAAGRVGREAA